MVTASSCDACLELCIGPRDFFDIAMQNNSITFERANPLQGLQSLARAIALPHEYAPTRYPSFPALERTAVMSFNSNASYSTGVGDVMGLLCRQAAYPLWLDQPFTNQVVSLAFDIAGATSGTGATSVSAITPVGPMRSWVVGNVLASATQVGVTGGSLTTLPYPIVGIDGLAAPGGREFFFVPSGWSFAVIVVNHVASTAVAATVTVAFETWLSPGEVSNDFTTTIVFNPPPSTRSAGSVVGPAAAGAWHRVIGLESTVTSALSSVQIVMSPGTISINNGSATVAATCTITAGSATSLYPFFYPLEFANSSLPWFSTRTTASSALFTNVTQVLNKSGSITAGRVSPQVQNPWSVTKSYLAALHPAEKAMLGLEAGFYTYVPPSTDMAEFWDYSIPSVSSSGVTVRAAPVYRLDNTSLVNVFYFTTPVIETFAVNVDYHIEFRTTSTLWQLGMSALTLESFHQAQIELMSHGFFYNNEDHKKLKGLLSRAGKAAQKLAPMAKQFLPPQARMAVEAGMMAQRLLSNRPGPTVKATSAVGSGMVKKAQKAKQTKQQKGKGKGKKH